MIALTILPVFCHRPFPCGRVLCNVLKRRLPKPLLKYDSFNLKMSVEAAAVYEANAAQSTLKETTNILSVID